MSSIPSWTGRLDPRDVLPRRVIHRLSRLDGPPGCPRPVRELSVRPPYFNVSQRIPRDDRPGSSQVESLCCVYVSATRQGLPVGGRYWDRTSDLCRVEADHTAPGGGSKRRQSTGIPCSVKVSSRPDTQYPLAPDSAGLWSHVVRKWSGRRSRRIAYWTGHISGSRTAPASSRRRHGGTSVVHAGMGGCELCRHQSENPTTLPGA